MLGQKRSFGKNNCLFFLITPIPGSYQNKKTTSMSRTLKLTIFWATPVVFLIIFYFYPLSNILSLSLARSENGWFIPFIDAIKSPSIRGVIWFTIWQAFLSTILTLIVGLPGAFLLARYQFRGKSLLRALTGVAFVMPTLVVAAGFTALFGPKGWLNAGLMALFQIDHPPLEFVNSLGAILVAHVFYNISIVLRIIGDFWTRLDPRLVQSANVLGANRWQAFQKVTLPLLSPALIAAALLIFVFDFTSFGVIIVLGGPRFSTIEVEIFYQTNSLFNLPLAAALSIIQLFCTLLLTIIYSRLMNRISKPINQRSLISNQKKLDNWRIRLFAILNIGFLLIFSTAPLIALAARSLISFGAERTLGRSIASGFTLEFYRELSNNSQQSLFYVPPSTAIGVSLGYALITMILAVMIGLPAAWALSRYQKSRLNQFIDPLIMLPLGTSSVTLGLGFILALDSPPLDLRASPILIPIAHTLVAIPFVIRSLTPSIKSIQPRLRTAASILGAAPWKVVRYVDFPLIIRAIIVAATFSFIISLGEFGATAMVARPEYPTIPIVIYRYLSRPGGLNYGQAMALSTLMMLTTILGMLAIERIRGEQGSEF